MKEPSKAKSSKKVNEAISYSDAVAELEQILEEIENGETDIDLLSEKMKRAVWLVQICREKLRKTDEEVRKIVSDIDSDEDDE